MIEWPVVKVDDFWPIFADFGSIQFSPIKGQERSKIPGNMSNHSPMSARGNSYQLFPSPAKPAKPATSRKWTKSKNFLGLYVYFWTLSETLVAMNRGARPVYLHVCVRLCGIFVCVYVWYGREFFHLPFPWVYNTKNELVKTYLFVFSRICMRLASAVHIFPFSYQMTPCPSWAAHNTSVDTSWWPFWIHAFFL